MRRIADLLVGQGCAEYLEVQSKDWEHEIEALVGPEDCFDDCSRPEVSGLLKATSSASRKCHMAPPRGEPAGSSGPVEGIGRRQRLFMWAAAGLAATAALFSLSGRFASPALPRIARAHRSASTKDEGGPAPSRIAFQRGSAGQLLEVPPPFGLNGVLWGQIKLRSGLCLRNGGPSRPGRDTTGRRHLLGWRSFGPDTGCHLGSVAASASGSAGKDGLVAVRSAESLAACKALCKLARSCRGIEYSGNASWCQLWELPVTGARTEPGRECFALGGAEGARAAAGAGAHVRERVQVALCDSGDEHQQWFYDGLNSRIRSWVGVCLEAAVLFTDGSPVFTAECAPSRREQSFEYDSLQGELRTRGVSQDGTQWCLDAPNGTLDGSQAEMYACLPMDANQAWNVGDEDWVSPLPALQPGPWSALPRACPDHFVAPPVPDKAIDLNGVALQDVCLNWTDQENRSAHVFIIGDWGGIIKHDQVPPLQPADDRAPHFEKPRDFVVGVDDWAQQRVAEQMRKRAPLSKPGYILNVGDNFYWGGVGTGGDYGAGQGVACGAAPHLPQLPVSNQWDQIFERVYWGEELDGKMWLGVLGNHDYGGYKFTAAWDQVIAYTWVQPACGKPPRWMTPAQYWSARVWYPDFSVDYYFLDTNVIDTGGPEDEPAHNMCNRIHNQEVTRCDVTGPWSVEDCRVWFSTLWETQYAWLESRLDASRAQWQIVVTHFPATYISGNWTYLANRYGIDLIVAGHAHLQVVQYAQDGFLPGTAHIISGGGGGITSEGKPDPGGADDQYGFMDMTLTRDELKIEAISHGGLLRSTTLVRPKGRNHTA